MAEIDRLSASGPSDLRAFRADVIEVLHRAIEFDWYAWVLTDPVTEVGVDPLATVPDLRELPQLVRLKYLTTVNRWTTLGSVASLAPGPGRSLLWEQAQRRHGVADVLSMVFRDPHGCWGFLDLWSRQTVPDAALDLVAEVLARLTQALRSRQAATFAATADLQGAPSGPAFILLDDDLGITGQTSSSPDWLARLLPPTVRSDPVPAAALNVAAQLLAQQAGVDAHPARARAHLGHGVWATLKAARVQPGGQIAVTIEPSTPAERLDLFARCHALSPRESQLLTTLAEGGDTGQVAARLFLSQHTVQDHLKAMFAKTGTHNRRTLLSHALGVKTAADYGVAVDHHPTNTRGGHGNQE